MEPLTARTHRFAEDLPALAAQAFDVARQRCGPCQHFHELWPYLRLARISAGAEGGRSLVEPALAGAIAEGRRRVLIAGAADTGLLALVARASDGQAEITMLDRCATPLELCERFAKRWALRIETSRVDLTALEQNASHHVVFAHSLLQFIPDDRRSDVLTRLRRVLAPGGRLIMVFRAGRRIAGPLLGEYRTGYPNWVLGELESLGVSLPLPRDQFRQRLADYGRAHESREGALPGAPEILNLITNAGFSIESCDAVETNLSEAARRFAAKLGKQRYVVVATPQR